jgi:hypothetical protein
MNVAAECLMDIIRTDLRQDGDHPWLETAVTSCLSVQRGPWLEKAAQEFVTGASPPGITVWHRFATNVDFERALQLASKSSYVPSVVVSKADATRIWEAIEAFASDEELGRDVIALRREMKGHSERRFLEERRRTIHAMATRDPKCTVRSLRALDFYEANLAAINLWLDSCDGRSDNSVCLAIQIFERWVDRKLKMAGLSFRLVLDRAASNYRIIPSEACIRLDHPDHVELRIIFRHTVLSACLIAYLTLQGIEGRIAEWVEVVDLIDRLAFAGVLERFIKCTVCGRWMYALNRRRDYCGDKCRYSVWAGTPKGKEKRRRASSAWRKRFSEEVRRATPNVRRRQRNP